jgi:aryl-alcohol dehydrogenase-like predicted oxidoreductase
LQLDYVDLIYCHRPDKETPIEETVWAMHQLIQSGKALYWGTSEWSALEIMQAHFFAEKNHLVPPVMEQPQYNMLWREKIENEFLLLFRDFGMGTTIWSPLASGLLSGKYNDADPKDTRFSIDSLEWLKNRLLVEDNIKKVKLLKGLADKLNTSLAKLAIAWCLKNPNVSTVILGASKVSQLQENLTAMDIIPLLTIEVMDEIDAITGTKPQTIVV